MAAKKVLILGAAGKDFHTFNCVFRGKRDEFEVVAITATQIPWIEDRVYPASLAGDGYPNGIPIRDEDDLEKLIKKYGAEECVFAYSDVSYEYIDKMKKRCEDAGASFRLSTAEETMVPSSVPVIAICAVRTGCGKSQTTRHIRDILLDMGLTVVAIRHPMPYGDLAKQAVQRFATIDDLKKHECTIEEMEEYEPHIVNNTIVYAGVDYHAILEQASKEADVILWDGGNNDTPFYRPDIHITVVDPHRPGNELDYYPGKDNFLMADIILFNKMDSADPENAKIILNHAKEYNPGAIIVYANSPALAEKPEMIKGKRALIVEDGPTCTHGGMKIGAGTVAAQHAGVGEMVDPRPYLKGSLIDTFKKYPGIGKLLPAMGYSDEQVKDLEDTINAVDCDVVVIGTPIDLRRLVKINKPSVRVNYNLEVISEPSLEAIIRNAFQAPMSDDCGCSCCG
ncbi:MAG: cyclic 2,3-diphosphoglycerate synthase [bacterium]|nr:cyclic 2,3-diphosphoglycerate synthase [bacterium]